MLTICKVFERLRALGLDGLQLADWRSTIRHLVAQLHGYGDIDRLTEKEEADIEYDDTDSQLERLILQEKSTVSERWNRRGLSNEVRSTNRTWQSPANPSKPVHFMVEVKTTINGRDEPFFVSRRQHELVSFVVLMPSSVLKN